MAETCGGQCTGKVIIERHSSCAMTMAGKIIMQAEMLAVENTVADETLSPGKVGRRKTPPIGDLRDQAAHWVAQHGEAERAGGNIFAQSGVGVHHLAPIEYRADVPDIFMRGFGAGARKKPVFAAVLIPGLVPDTRRAAQIVEPGAHRGATAFFEVVEVDGGHSSS